MPGSREYCAPCLLSENRLLPLSFSAFRQQARLRYRRWSIPIRIFAGDRERIFPSSPCFRQAPRSTSIVATTAGVSRACPMSRSLRASLPGSSSISGAVSPFLTSSFIRTTNITTVTSTGRATHSFTTETSTAAESRAHHGTTARNRAISVTRVRNRGAGTIVTKPVPRATAMTFPAI